MPSCNYIPQERILAGLSVFNIPDGDVSLGNQSCCPCLTRTWHTIALVLHWYRRAWPASSEGLHGGEYWPGIGEYWSGPGPPTPTIHSWDHSITPPLPPRCKTVQWASQIMFNEQWLVSMANDSRKAGRVSRKCMVLELEDWQVDAGRISSHCPGSLQRMGQGASGMASWHLLGRHSLKEIPSLLWLRGTPLDIGGGGGLEFLPGHFYLFH